MNPALIIRPLTQDEQTQLNRALRCADAFGLRRAQYLLASARGLKPREIAATYGGCAQTGGCEQTVRNVIRAFHAVGLDCLRPKSNRPNSAQPRLSDQNLEQLRHLLHQCPRTFGKNR